MGRKRQQKGQLKNDFLQVGLNLRGIHGTIYPPSTHSIHRLLKTFVKRRSSLHLFRRFPFFSFGCVCVYYPSSYTSSAVLFILDVIPPTWDRLPPPKQNGNRERKKKKKKSFFSFLTFLLLPTI